MNELFRKALFLPEQASTIAKEVDQLHYFVITTTMIASFLVGTIALLLFVRYRRRSAHERTARVVSPFSVEAACVALPLSFFLLWFFVGFRTYVKIATPPKDAMDVYVMGKQWMWKFSYPDGPNAIGTLHVPVGRPVRLLMTSRDVIHSFYVPSFRIKQDVLPGRYTQIWFEATEVGSHQILCAEFCGTGHSQMWGEIVVLPQADFDRWLADQKRVAVEKYQKRQDMGGPIAPDPPTLGNLAEQGRKLAASSGCLKCHSVDGEPHIGPTWLDLYGREEVMQDGARLTVDESYITESMMDPRAKIVAGYQPVMPTYRGRLVAPETAAIVEFIKSLHQDRVQPAPSKGPVYDPRR